MQKQKGNRKGTKKAHQPPIALSTAHYRTKSKRHKGKKAQRPQHRCATVDEGTKRKGKKKKIEKGNVRKK
jgi:hypothetical protein